MEAARALVGSVAAVASARRASGSATSRSGTSRGASGRLRVERLGGRRWEARGGDGEVCSSAASSPRMSFGGRGFDVGPIASRGARVTTHASGDATGGAPDGRAGDARSPPAKPRRRQRTRSTSATPPGSSFSEIADGDIQTESRAAAAAARLRSERMKSPAATKALSSVRATAAAGRIASGDGLAKIRGTPNGNSNRAVSTVVTQPASHNTSRNTLTSLRKEASTILRALGAARAAPGGLRDALGDDPELTSRLLGALCRAGMVVQASSLLREACAGGVPVRPDALECVVRHAARAGRVTESNALAAFVEYRLSALASDDALSAKTKNPHLPTLRTYTDLISALGKAEARRRKRYGAVDDEASVTQESTQEESKDSRTVTAIQIWRLLLRDQKLAPETLTPDGAAYTAAVAASLASGDVQHAELLTREMRRAGVEAGPRLYNVLIAHKGKVHDLDGIRAVERQMQIAKVRPNAATHGARVAAYARCGEIELAERALESGRSDSRKYARPTVRAYTAMVQAYAKRGNVSQCKRWLTEMKKDGVLPNTHTYTVVVDGLVECGNPSEAEQVILDMRAAGVEPTAVTYNCLLKSCMGNTSTNRKQSGEEESLEESFKESPASRLTRAKRVLEEMRSYGVPTTVVTFNTLIDACVRAGEPTEQMFGILSNLISAGHRPDVVTYTTLLKHFSREGDVVASRWLMREMETDTSVSVDLSAFNALVDAFSRKGLTREATDTVARMKKLGHMPDAATYGALLDGFARVGDAESAGRLYAALKGGRSGDGGKSARRWTPSWAEDSSHVVDQRAPSPDRRMRLAVVSACAQSVALGTSTSSTAQLVVEGVIADAAARGADDAAAEAIALRAKWKRESANAGVVAGQTMVRPRTKSNMYGSNRPPVQAVDPRVGCPIPSSWGPSRNSESQSGGSSRRERRRDQRVRDAGATLGTKDTLAQTGSGSYDEGVTRGFEMWKHWLGLPSRYYVGEEGPNGGVKNDAKSPMTVAENKRVTEASSSSESASSESSKQKYTKLEIAEAVKTLRLAASKKFPGDPESALKFALEAAEEGDAGRFRGDEEEEEEEY